MVAVLCPAAGRTSVVPNSVIIRIFTGSKRLALRAFCTNTTRPHPLAAPLPASCWIFNNGLYFEAFYDVVVKSSGSLSHLLMSSCQHRSIVTNLECGQCPLWCPPCWIYVVPSVQCRKVWLTPTTTVPCSKAAKTRNPLNLSGVPQTNEPISAASKLKFTILWRRGGCIAPCLTGFFVIVNMCLSWIDIARQSCADGEFFFAYCIFSEPCAARFRPSS